MLSEPRTITILTELVHVPAAHAAEKLREVYNEVCRTCGYENFIRVQGGARIERGEPEVGGVSQVTFLADRIQIAEEHTGVTMDQFGRKTHAVLACALPTLGIPFLLVQVCTVRAITAPNTFRGASEYLARSLFRIQPEDLQTFQRPTSVFGFRLVFPPTNHHPHNFNVRVECYARDGRSLYLENVGTFKAPIQTANLEDVERNLRTTSEFLLDNVVSFLSIYDRKESS